MNSVHWELFRYSLPLIEPLRMLRQVLNERRGLILRLSEISRGNSAAESFGEGEIAPLPGLHPESLSQAESQIREYLSGNLKFTVRSGNFFGSVRFGLDMAQRTLAQSRQESAGRNYMSAKNEIYKKQIPVNGLTSASGKQLELECKYLQDAGFKTIKIKVGRETVQEDIERVRSACKILGDEISVRLDSNRSWEWEEALEFAHAIKGCGIEYCEEPLREFQRLEELHQQTGIPLALDETLWKNPDPHTLPKFGIQTLILKPGIIGAWESTKFWTAFAEKNKMNVVLSSSFESGLSLHWIAFTSAKLFRKQPAAGLDTAKCFEHDLIDPPFKLTNGSYVFPAKRPIANEKYLKKIAEGNSKITTETDV
ncbi:MAG: o-succinylbenzoate synthase [SAR324 cluster bacterium]